MKQILVAVDQHAHAQQIVDSAIELAEAMSAKVFLLYVVKNKSVPSGFVDMHGDKIPEHYYRDQFHRVTDGLVKKIMKAGLQYEGICGVGDPRDLILRTAKSRNVDYVVIGIHGFRGLSRLKAIGSLARNVIESSAVPVLAIP
jgi:nucleotide-binding universal stress UspA family protein